MKSYFFTSLLTAACCHYLLAIPIQAELVAYYPLDGDFNDSSGNGNEGTFFGGTEYSDSVPAQLGAGMSVEFDGTAGTYGSINDGEGGLALTKSPSHSVSMWVRGDGTANSDDRVFSEGMTTNNGPLFNVGTKNDSADGTVDFFFRNGGSPGHLFSFGEAFDGEWHHLAWVDNGGVVELYIDGEFDTEFDYSDFSNESFAPDTTTIGGILRGGDCCNFLGSIDDVGMWDDPLSPEEISSLAAGTSPLALRGGGSVGLVSYWNFDDDTANDVVGSNNAEKIVDAGFSADTPSGSGKSLDLTGDDYVKLPDTDFGIGATKTFTISTWMNLTSSERGAVSILHDLTSGGGDRSGITLGASADGSAFVGIIASTGNEAGDAANGGATFRDITTDLIVPVGEWAHLAASVDGDDRLTVYLDGVAAQTYTVNPAESIDEDGGNVTGGTGFDFIDSDGSFTGFGASGNGPAHADSLGDFTRLFYDGLLDEVAIWNVALPASSIQMLKDGTDPREVPILATDNDGDGLPNSFEDQFAFLDSNNADDAGADQDGDGLTNLEEFQKGTDLEESDTDGDGLTDNVETNTGTFVGAEDTGTNPLESDTDEDGLADGVETGTGAFVDEDNTGSDPNKKDTDGDGFNDGTEVAGGFDPTDVTIKPDTFASLVAWWQLDRVNGTTTPDSSGNGRDMELNEMDATNLVAGKFGSALTFDGATEMLTRVHEEGDDLPISQHEQYTVGLWVKGAFNGQVGGGDRRVFSEGSDIDNDPLLNIGTHNAGADATVDIFLRSGGSPGHQYSFGSAFDGEWHHITWVRDGDEGLLYIDGELDDQVWSFLDTYVPDVTNNTSIGGILRAAQSHWFTGAIDEVAVFKDALDEGQIAQLVAGTLLTGENPDKDNDGLPDAWEEANGVTDPAADEDGDGLTNLEEFEKRTEPNKKDTDGDGLDDNVETGTGTFVGAGDTGTDPLEPDTDGDGLSDGVETNNTGTSPVATDTDGDTYADNLELEFGTDPTDPDSKPTLDSLLLAYWPLESINGEKTPDESGNGLDLDVVNMTEDNIVAGRVGNAFLFSRLDETMLTYVAAEEGDDLLPISQYEQYTISLWVNADHNEQEAADLRVFSEASTSNNDPLLNIGTHNSNADATVDIYLRNAGGGIHQHSVAEAFDGEWHHIAWVRDRDQLAMYIDGVLDGTDWIFWDPYRPEVTNTTSVGGILRGAPSHWIDGMIDEVSLWAGALSASDVAALASGEPLGGGSVFQIVAIEFVDGNLTLTWTSKPGKVYSVEQGSDLAAWQELDDGVQSDGDETSFTFPQPAGATQYFRVIEQ